MTDTRFVVSTDPNAIWFIDNFGTTTYLELRGNTWNQLYVTGSRVAFNAVDRFVVATSDDFIVITRDGDVWGNDISHSLTIGHPFAFGGSKVASSHEDDHFVTMAKRGPFYYIIVVRRDGRVYGHYFPTITSVSEPFILSGPRVAADAEDRFVVSLGDLLMVFRRDGQVWGHEADLDATKISDAFRFDDAPWTNSYEDFDTNFIVASGNRLIKIVHDDQMVAYEVSGRTIGNGHPIVARPLG